GAQPGAAAHPPCAAADGRGSGEVGRYPRRIGRRIFFSLLHSGYVRNYEGAIRLLCERGHHVHVALVRDEKHPGDELLLDRLATDHEAFTFAASPTRPRLDPWRAAAFAVRSLADIARYGDPDYAEAHTLRARSVAKLGLGRIGSRTLAPLLLRLGAPTSRERVRRRLALLQRAEDALPPSRTIARALTAFRPDLVLASPVVEFGSSQVDVLDSARSLGLRTGVSVAS